ncbi:aminoglycoside adenylyltransferase domain-containing protein [Streptomyces inhibens]|uniref:aminoglycoside adenylyltransferase domain-containing protein n=1 Tax=Streptomyces inhibens TaxID=2293571 RepID=UPI0037A66DCB
MDNPHEPQAPRSAAYGAAGRGVTGCPFAVQQVLPDLLHEVRSALGDRLVGMYLYGSAVSGDYDEGVSDIDLMAAVTGELSPDVLSALDAGHHRFWSGHPEFTDRIDLIYAPAAYLSGELNASATPPILATVSPGSPLHAEPVSQEWILNRHLVHDTGVTVHGRPLECAVTAVPAETVRAAVARKVLSLRDGAAQVVHRGGDAYVVLTACRALLTLTTARHASKADAARWARERWPGFRPVIDAALEWRLGQAVRDETPLPRELSAQRDGLLDAVCRVAEDRTAGVVGHG